ncbi:hypothetical protein H2199_007121 [Coniosporium tulheliwenetii]|uniref:Uncharacterized protein n=1 Tax=Coniosporium tulheliwenetii TaxID=3383036 RepID=A0ACC2YSU4_9PEZI|nr:hypothetical protein H2199_007121 [Cladosporium sp. JES 115]
MTYEKALPSRRAPSPRRIARYFGASRRLKPLCAFAVVAYVLLSTSIKLWGTYWSNAPTDLSPLYSPTTSPSLPLPEHPARRLIRTSNAVNIGDRYSYLKPLSAGCEGNTAIYRDEETGSDVVIKSFRTQLRNRLPEYARRTFAGSIDYWPAEIPATLLLGGMMNVTSESNTTETVDVSFKSDFVPAVDYFLIVSSESGAPVSPTWRLVTPFIRGGTLQTLASKLKEDRPQKPHELDAFLRPAFNRLLAALRDLHAKELCHDDIKIDNIFALDQTRWLIGDLGRAREVQHPYHYTHGWQSKNQWSECRLNDVRRMLKTYLTVLRTAAADADRFDAEFYTERQPWSKLYWDFMRRPALAGELLGRSSNSSVELAQVHEDSMEVEEVVALGGFMPKYRLERNLHVAKAEFET